MLCASLFYYRIFCFSFLFYVVECTQDMVFILFRLGETTCPEFFRDCYGGLCGNDVRLAVHDFFTVKFIIIILKISL